MFVIASFDCFLRGLYRTIKYRKESKGRWISGHDFENYHTTGTAKERYLDGSIDVDVCKYCGKESVSIYDWDISDRKDEILSEVTSK